MNMRPRHHSLFRLLFKGFQAAETPEAFSKVGYSWLLPLGLIAGSLLSLVTPSPAWLTFLTQILAKRTSWGSIVENFPALIAASILIWITGFSIPTIRNSLGRLTGNTIIYVADRWASFGETLAERRLLSFLLVVGFTLLGFTAYLRYSTIVALQEQRIRLADRWLAELTPVIETSTHSIRDIPSLQRLEPKFSKPTAELIEHHMGRDWHPLVCLAGFIDSVFGPLSDVQGDGILKGERWKQRMRSALWEMDNNGCLALNAADSKNDIPARALDLLNLLSARSYYRLAGESCPDYWALPKAYESLGKMRKASLASSRDSVLGNIYGCAALVYSRTPEAIRDLGKICHSTEDCYNLALEAHSRSASPYEACSFQHLRTLNNKTDLTLKLATRRWNENAPSGLTFLDAPTAIQSLSDYNASLISCLGRERTPTEVTVTIAQSYGTLTEISTTTHQESRRDVFLRKAGFFLATSILHAPDDFGSWELKYFCGALNSKGHELESGFASSLQLTGLPQTSQDELLERIKAACP